MDRKRFVSLALAAALGAATGLAAAADLARGDRKFIDEAGAGGMFEVEVSKLAEKNAADASVKQFAAMLVGDHSKAGDELKQIATSKGHPPPAALPKDKQKKIDQLAKKSGADFDKAYMKEVGLDDHKKDIKLFEKQAKDGKDPDLKAFAAKTLPTLQHHLQMAQGNPVNQRR